MLDPRIDELPPKIRVLLMLYVIMKRDRKIVLEYDEHTHWAILKAVNSFKHTHGIRIRSTQHTHPDTHRQMVTYAFTKAVLKKLEDLLFEHGIAGVGFARK